MVKRVLPERRNPLLEPAKATSVDVLVERRRLGQTNLGPKSGVAGLAGASNQHGTFDYAHLRVPLPKDLDGSGIFAINRTSSYPDSYFLMRRSSDGYISATGMFKAAFPWASVLEEEAERRHQKTFPSSGQEEVAGSVWIAPDEALYLADEYAMRNWIEALLDPTPIEKASKTSASVHIQAPPTFDIHTAAPYHPAASSLRSTRARSTRSASPSKIATPARKIATPRKPRATRSAIKSELPKTEDMVDAVEAAAASATNALQDLVANGTTKTETLISEVVNGDSSGVDVKSDVDDLVKDGTVRIEVQETVEQNGNVETTTTNVKIDVPHSHPELPEPEDPAKMIEEAKKMVQEAQKLEAGSSSGVIKSSKRKVEDADLTDERPTKAAKVAYTTEQKLTKEKVTRRALVGLGVMAAIGTAFQYFA